MKTTFNAWSRDPITLWHKWMDIMFSEEADRHGIIMWTNPEKKYRFSRQERTMLVELMMKDRLFENGWNIEVIQSDTIAYRDSRRYYWNSIVSKKWVRWSSDKKYEQAIHDISLEQMPANDWADIIELIMVDSTKDISHISSSLLRNLCSWWGKIYSLDKKKRLIDLVIKPFIEARLKWQYRINLTWAMWSWKSYIWEMLVKIAKRLWIEAHHIDIDKIRHYIIWESTAEYHVETREKIMKRLEMCEQEDGKEYGEYINNVFTDDWFIQKEWRTFIREKIAFVNPDDKTRIKQLTAIAWPVVDLELDIKLANMKWLIILNNALIAENNTSYRGNNNTVLISSNRQKEQAQNRDNVDEATSDKYMKFQASTKRKEQALLETIATDETWTLHLFQNDMAGDKEVQLLLNLILETIDVDGKLRFDALTERLHLEMSQKEKKAAFDQVRWFYETKEREHHARRHPLNMWNRLYAIADQLSDEELNIYELSIIFHDLMMKFSREPWYVDEEKSADRASKIMKDRWISQHIIDKVRAMIMRTRHSVNEKPMNFLEAHLVANDLIILASDYKTYMKYADNIRKEYSHASSEAYLKWRKAFLDKMLQKNEIMPVSHYERLAATDKRITSKMIDDLKKKEEIAQLNLEQELMILECKTKNMEWDKFPDIQVFEWHDQVMTISMPDEIVLQRNKISKTEKRSFFIKVWDKRIEKWSKWHFRELENMLREYYENNDEARDELLETQWYTMWVMHHDQPHSVLPDQLLLVLLRLREEFNKKLLENKSV